MEVHIRNLGPIRDAMLDMKPLTVFIGPNNAGKTWMAYAMAGIFGEYGLQRYLNSYLDAPEQFSGLYPPIDTVIQQVLDEGNATIDMVQFADDYGETLFNAIASEARTWLPEFMGTKFASFNDLDIRMRLGSTKERFLNAVKASSLVYKMAPGRKRKEGALNILKEADNPLMYFYTTEENFSNNSILKLAGRFIFHSIFTRIIRALYIRSFTFPAERNTLINYFSSFDTDTDKDFNTNRRFDVSYDQIKKGTLSIPIQRFISMMEMAFDVGSSERSKQIENHQEIHEYIQLAKLLERDILSGSVDFSTPEPSARREILYQVGENIHLDMTVTSSMLKELAPLVLYLRYLARPGELLVIDEPEMNLHPEAQAKMIEFLAMLVNAGLHVMITTHSPYIIDHLGTLLAAAAHDEPESIREKFFLQRTEAFIPKEQVSVYLVEGGTATSAFDEEKIIDWGTFGSISERLMQIYFDL